MRTWCRTPSSSWRSSRRLRSRCCRGCTGVVRNGALAAGRGEARRRRRQDRASASEAWFAAADDHIDGREATRLLAELPLEQREVVVARIWGGLTFEEVARLAGCSLPTAHRRFQAGLAVLRERLEQAMDADTPRHEDDLSEVERRLAGWQPASGRPRRRRHALRRWSSGRPARARCLTLAGVVCPPDRAGRGAGRLGPVGAHRASSPGRPSSRTHPDTQHASGTWCCRSSRVFVHSRRRMTT